MLRLAKLLYIDSLHHFLAVGYRRLFKSLTATQFFNNAGALVFSFEFLEGFLNILAFLYLYNDHAF